MGKIHKTTKQRPGYNTYKTVMALRMASQNNGTTAMELGQAAGCSTQAARGTLQYLVVANECRVITDEGDSPRYFSNVYRDHTPIDPPDTYKDSVISAVLETQAGMIAQYPVAIFGEQGLFISRVIAKACNDILGGINDIT